MSYPTVIERLHLSITGTYLLPSFCWFCYWCWCPLQI